MVASYCVFPCKDVNKTAEYYVAEIGFKRVDYLDLAKPHICLYRDNIEIILTKILNGQKVISNHVLYGYGGDAYVIVKD